MGTPAHTHSQGSRIYTHTQTHTLTHAHVHVTRSHTPRTCKHPPHTRALTHAHSRSRTPGLSCRPRRRWPRVFPDTHKHMGVQIQTHTPDSRTCLVGLHASTSRGTHVCTHRHTCISLCSKTDGPEDAGPCTPGPGSLASGGGVFAFTWIEQPALFWDLGVGRGASSTLKCLWQNSPRQERRQAVLRRKSPEQLQPSPALGPRGNIPPRWTATELPALEMQEGAAGLQVPSTPSTRQPRKQGPGSCDGVSRAAPTP